MDDTGALLDPNILKELEFGGGGGGGGGERASSGGLSSTVVNEKNMELLMDVSLEISVRLGQVKMQIRDLLKLNKGSLIELGREADDPLEIHVNNRLLAYGEVVMIKDKLGIRITDIVSLSERLENLRR
ncbi:MAG: flagellar motor switch protein FliN [Magnetococcales bacterium]|nr:flagellar motor switch protein FliN [Magnetococcales bacterium]MBF0260617.1 flagellar motor switch protein FliN [Magnetococcales bacterium]